jgi:hypothetical protein
MSRTSSLSPEKVTEVVQRQHTFTFGVNKNQRIPSRDHTQVSHFAKLWHDRLLSRKTTIHKEFQVERKVLSHLD